MCPHSATDRFEIENVGVKQRPDGRCIAEFGADEEDEEEDEFLADIFFQFKEKISRNGNALKIIMSQENLQVSFDGK